jgi:hypothetical protein
MKKFWDLFIISLLTASIMIVFVSEVIYSKELSKQIVLLNNEMDSLIDESKKLTYELEKTTSIENLIGGDLSKCKVSLNKVIVVHRD